RRGVLRPPRGGRCGFTRRARPAQPGPPRDAARRDQRPPSPGPRRTVREGTGGLDLGGAHAAASHHLLIGAAMAEHVFDASVYHHAWNRDLEPALAIAPGDVVHFDLLMAGDRQVQEGAAFEDCAFDFDTLYNLAGPVHIEGAEPGDTLSVEILSLETGDWGWCVILPELGLLPE